jgi:hypothetical protein
MPNPLLMSALVFFLEIIYFSIKWGEQEMKNKCSRARRRFFSTFLRRHLAQ